jgi:hypothetical protein
MEATCYFETSVYFRRTTYIPEDGTLTLFNVLSQFWKVYAVEMSYTYEIPIPSKYI